MLLPLKLSKNINSFLVFFDRQEILIHYNHLLRLPFSICIGKRYYSERYYWEKILLDTNLNLKYSLLACGKRYYSEKWVFRRKYVPVNHHWKLIIVANASSSQVSVDLGPKIGESKVMVYNWPSLLMENEL